MQLRTPESLVAEFREIVDRQAPSLRSQSLGQCRFLEMGLQTPKSSPYWWAHQAHVGSLDKLQGLLRRDGALETLELLAVARNIFENLVWLRLICGNPDYGLVFYAHLLRDQISSLQAQIRKLGDEADLFEAMDEVDRDNLMATLGRLSKTEKPESSALAQAQDDHGARTALLDDQVRREFCLFAAPARFNGYRYQARLLRTKVIPPLVTRLAETQAEAAEAPAVLQARLGAPLLGVAMTRWVWKDRATEANLSKHYDFLYSFTSKLLHATPLNIITEKTLNESEAHLVLDYIVIAAADLLAQIEAFRYPGQVKAVYIETD